MFRFFTRNEAKRRKKYWDFQNVTHILWRFSILRRKINLLKSHVKNFQFGGNQIFNGSDDSTEQGEKCTRNNATVNFSIFPASTVINKLIAYWSDIVKLLSMLCSIVHTSLLHTATQLPSSLQFQQINRFALTFHAFFVAKHFRFFPPNFS